jgi:glutaredoxin
MRYLDDHGIAYTKKDVEETPAFAEEALAKSGQRGIPVVDIKGDIIVGFDRPQIDAKLAAHNISA